MIWKKVEFGSFLFERRERFKPVEANSKGLKRIEKIDFSGKYYLADKPTNTDMILVKKGDLLISGINAEKGAVTIYQEEEDALATIHYSSYEFDNTQIDIGYLRWFLKSAVFSDLLKRMAGGGIKTELKSKHLLPLEVALPSLKKQSEIVIRLEKRVQMVCSVDLEIRQQQSYLQLLRQAILQEAVQGKITKHNLTDEHASGLLNRIKAEKRKLIAHGKLKKEKPFPPITAEEIPFELPEGWEWCRLGEIVNLASGVTLGKSYKETLFKVPYLRVANVQRGFVDTNNIKELQVPKYEIDKCALKRGDLVMIEGGDWDKVGRCAIWDGRIDPCIHQNHIFRLRFYGNISSHWAELFLNSPTARRYFESCSKQTTNLASINKTQLSYTLFPLPSSAEQINIVTSTRRLFQIVRQLEEQVVENLTQAQLLLETVLKTAFEVPNSIPMTAW